MKPKIKQKRIDPRYFLNETIDRDKLEEIASPKRDDDNKGPKKKMVNPGRGFSEGGQIVAAQYTIMGEE